MKSLINVSALNQRLYLTIIFQFSDEVYTIDMFLAKKLTVKGSYSVIRILIAVCFIFIGPLLDTLHASALSMNHDMQSTQNCASVCVSNKRINVQYEAPVFHDEKKLPTPPLDLPYYMQFRDVGFSTPLPPLELIYSSSFKPPDINTLYSVFRI